MSGVFGFLATGTAVFFTAITPSGVTVEVFIEMLPTGFEFFADKADPIQIDSHGKFLVLLLNFAVAGALLRQCLMVHRQGEHDICADLSGMKLAVKTAKLNRVVAMEETMEIEKVVAAVMVVTVAVTAISGVRGCW